MISSLPPLKRGGAGRGDGMILIAGTAADANRTDYPSIQLQRNAAGKNMILPLLEA